MSPRRRKRGKEKPPNKSIQPHDASIRRLSVQAPLKQPTENRLGKTLINWFRSVGLISILVGGLQVVAQPEQFWMGTIFVYAGILFASLDVYFESELSIQRKVGLWIVLVALTTVFSWKVVFTPAPITFGAITSQIDYHESGPAGILWSPAFTELDVIISNPSDGDYDDVDLLIRPDYPVAAIAQFTNLPGVSFENYFGIANRVEVDANKTKVGLDFLATDAGYKIRCPKLPRNSSLQMVMALVNPNRTETKKLPLTPLTLEDLSLEQTMTENGVAYTAWFGNSKNRLIYAPGAKPRRVFISGSFVGNYRERRIEHEIEVLP